MSSQQKYINDAEVRLMNLERQMLRLFEELQELAAPELPAKLCDFRTMEQRARRRLAAVRDAEEHKWQELQADLEESMVELDSALADIRLAAGKTSF